MTDKVYIFDKITKTGTLLGEIQSGFNMSFVIDGTKDSAKVEVWSFSDVEIEPYTILLHQNTSSWWIVSNDKIERYQNENGFVYVHNLELLGAIELLNARDLTDCGFNDRTYTVNEFLQRLFKLSSFSKEWDDLYIYQDQSFLNKTVDFIKTFENYTYLSAIREFLDAYNMSAKLDFDYVYNSTSDNYSLRGPNLEIIPKTGDLNSTYDVDDFGIVNEIKTTNKDSFGTSVVSNAENVISSIEKTYPSVGSVRPSSASYDILAQNAFVRLPSKVFKANWLKLVFKYAEVRIDIKLDSYEGVIRPSIINGYPIPYNNVSIDNYIRKATYIVQQEGSSAFYNDYLNFIQNHMDRIYQFMLDAASITLYNGNKLNPVTGEIVKGNNIPYIPSITFNAHVVNGSPYYGPLIFCDKEMRDGLPRTWQAIYWERGSNKIDGFNPFEADTGTAGQITISKDEMIRTSLGGNDTFVIHEDSNGNYVRLVLDSPYTCHFRDTHWVINYYPMSDLKVKLDNQTEKFDIQLYNQNGKLTDAVAFSKLLDSYSKEISSDTITRNMIYYDFDNVPKVGSIVYKNDIPYVINNVSLDFSQNENGYYIEGEFTMSKYVSTKSLMVNPNTNVRDYGIPQNYNVKRKQVYRDYFKLEYTTNNDYSYLIDPIYLFNLDNLPKKMAEYTAVIKLTYDDIVGGDSSAGTSGSDTWYYQLDTTNYVLNKSFLIVCDFNDNNTIGYCSQNVFSGFDISRVLSSGMLDTLNTPISYTDDNGRVKSFDLLFLDNNSLTGVYDTYQASQSGGSSFTGSLYNYSIFIPQEIFNNSVSYKTFEIKEDDYDKDALEVPVFEYICQIADSEDVLIGDNILLQRNDMVYFYSYITGSNLNQNNVVPQNHVTQLSSNAYAMTFTANFRVSPIGIDGLAYDHIAMQLRAETIYNSSLNIFGHGALQVIPRNTDIAIFRHSYNVNKQEEIVDLMFILKNIPSSAISGATLFLPINWYKTY